MSIDKLVTVLGEMERGEAASARKTRGPYKRYLADPTIPITRQTRCNWRRQGEEPQADDTTSDCSSESSSAMYVYGGDGNESTPLLLNNSDPDCSPSSTSISDASMGTGEQSPSPTPECSPAPLAMYPGAQISESTGVLILQSLASRHGLTQAAQSDILRVLKLHMPENGAPATYNSLYRMSSGAHCSSQAALESTHVKHTLCGHCSLPLHDVDHSDSGCQGSKYTTFFELPIDIQIQALFKGIYIHAYSAFV